MAVNINSWDALTRDKDTIKPYALEFPSWEPRTPSSSKRRL